MLHDLALERQATRALLLALPHIVRLSSSIVKRRFRS